MNFRQLVRSMPLRDVLRNHLFVICCSLFAAGLASTSLRVPKRCAIQPEVYARILQNSKRLLEAYRVRNWRRQSVEKLLSSTEHNVWLRSARSRSYTQRASLDAKWRPVPLSRRLRREDRAPGAVRSHRRGIKCHCRVRLYVWYLDASNFSFPNGSFPASY